LNNEKTQVDLKGYWSIVARRKTLIIIPLMIVPLVAFLVTYFMTPTYVSSVTILLSNPQVLPVSVERDFEGRSGFDYGRISLQERQSSYLSQITSTKYLRRLIATLNLPITDAVRKIVATTKANYPQISENDLAENILADQIRKKVAVDMTANNLIEVSYTSADPVKAQRMAGALADIFIEENLAAELAGVTSSIAFSEDQLAFYKDKLKNAEERLRNYRANLLTSSFGQDTSGVTLREVSNAVQTLDFDISNQQDIQAALRTRLAQENIDISSLGLPAPIVGKKDRLLNNASRLSDLLTSYDWRDVRIYSLNEEARNLITEVTNDIYAWVNQLVPEYNQEQKTFIADYFAGNINIEFNRTKRAILDQYILKAKSMAGEDPATEITVSRLQSEINSYERFYDLFVSHSQNAAISQSAKKVEAEAKFTIIKPAALPLSPDSPDRIRILGMGIALGLMIGFGAVMLVEILDNSFKKVEDITEHLNLKVIGTIPRMEIPFADTGKRKIPIAIGVGVSFLLVLVIIILNFKRNG
jgi:uncharacterized protein involved in exopolysaccharide biosynthesis